MTAKLYAMTCGRLGGDFGRLMEGGEGTIDLPIPSFLIEHPKGRALYDTGMHPQCRTDPPGGWASAWGACSTSRATGHGTT
jgi:hypothetical protein